MKITKARYDANKKYNAKAYKRIQADIKVSAYDRIDEYCARFGISKAQFIVRACGYFISANILPPDESEPDIPQNNAGENDP